MTGPIITLSRNTLKDHLYKLGKKYPGRNFTREAGLKTGIREDVVRRILEYGPDLPLADVSVTPWMVQSVLEAVGYPFAREPDPDPECGSPDDCGEPDPSVGGW